MPLFTRIQAVAFTILCASGTIASGEQAFSGNVQRLMDDLSRNSLSLRPLPDPIIEPKSHEKRRIEDYMGYVERDLAELRRLDKNAETSPILFRGKPFNSTIKDALTLIKANRALLAAVPAQETLRLMGDLSSSCRLLRPFPEPIPEPKSKEMRWFETYSQYVERDLAKLREMDENAETSPILFGGKPFNSTLKDALALIEANRAALAAVPKKEALEILDRAISEGKLGIEWMANPTRYYK